MDFGHSRCKLYGFGQQFKGLSHDLRRVSYGCRCGAYNFVRLYCGQIIFMPLRPAKNQRARLCCELSWRPAVLNGLQGEQHS
jgi:hypothetical protein